MFAVTTCLRFLAAEEGTDVEDLNRLWQLVEAVIQVGSHSSRGPFRAQGDICTVAFFVWAVIEAVHFMLDNIGTFADGTMENAGLFEYGRFNAFVTIDLGYFCSHSLDKV